MIMIISSIIIGCVSSIILYITKPFLEQKNMDNAITAYNYLDSLSTNLINYYMINRGIYDVLIGDTNISEKDYNTILSEMIIFVWDNIPNKIQVLIIKYMYKDQIQQFILFKVDSEMSKLYTPNGIDELKEEE